VIDSVTEVTRVAGGAGVRDLWTRGGPLREPASGELARRLGVLREGGRRSAREADSRAQAARA
jgi:hypothetical protein